VEVTQLATAFALVKAGAGIAIMDSFALLDGLPPNLILIEDEPQIGAYLGCLLGIVDIVGSLSDAKQALGNFKYDPAIVDRMLPDGDALAIVMVLSQLPEGPTFIMLTAKDSQVRRDRWAEQCGGRLSWQALRAARATERRAF
jgi:CheY-like chemotaxis protein